LLGGGVTGGALVGGALVGGALVGGALVGGGVAGGSVVVGSEEDGGGLEETVESGSSGVAPQALTESSASSASPSPDEISALPRRPCERPSDICCSRLS
jgi:hypothetical protein